MMCHEHKPFRDSLRLLLIGALSALNMLCRQQKFWGALPQELRYLTPHRAVAFYLLFLALYHAPSLKLASFAGIGLHKTTAEDV